ncbi:hypothetical protein ACROYT_G005268 [Oculina patagonica]
MIMHRQPFIGPIQALNLGDSIINWTTSERLLGVQVDNKMSWSDHAANVAKSFASKLSLLRRMRFLPREQLEDFYTRVILPSVTYGLVLWGSCNKTHLSNLEKLHTRAGRIVYGLPWDTSTEDVPTRTRWDSLEEVYKKRLSEFVFKCIKGHIATEFTDLFVQKNSSRESRRNGDIILPRAETNMTRNSINDSFKKKWPMVDLLECKFSAAYVPGKNITVDEGLVKFNGRLSFKQYMPVKPDKFGIKVWLLADAETYYVPRLQVYLGKDQTNIDLFRWRGLGHYVVWTLGEPFLDAHRHFFFDNFFTSADLMLSLHTRNTYACSTACTNRRDFPADLKRTKLVHDEVRTRQSGNLVTTMWRDERVVSIMSTNTAPQPEITAVESACRRKKKASCPAQSEEEAGCSGSL